MDLIVKMIFGSHLYGTAIERSDCDYKGIFLPTREEILLGRVPKCRQFSSAGDGVRNTPQDVDVEIYSLPRF